MNWLKWNREVVSTLLMALIVVFTARVVCNCRSMTLTFVNCASLLMSYGIVLISSRRTLAHVVGIVAWSLESTLSSMRSQLDALSPLSSQSFATLQVKAAALEEVYEKWVAGKAVANEEGDKTDGDDDGHIGVRFRSWKSDSDGEGNSAAKDRKPPSG